MKNKWLIPLTLSLSLLVILIAASGLWLLKRHVDNYANDVATQTQMASHDVLTLYHLQQQLGYGGFIHHFKNYVLRRDTHYYELASQNILAARADLLALERGWNGHNEINTSALHAKLNEYNNKLELARALLATEQSTSSIDKQVKVDDSAALAEIANLTHNVISDFQLSNSAVSNGLNELGLMIRLGYFWLFPQLALTALVLVLFNISAARTRALESSRRSLQSLLDTTPDSILSVSEQGIILQANASAKEYFGYGAELEGMSMDQLLPEGARQAHAQLRQDFFYDPNIRMMAKGRRVQARKANGELRDVSVSLGHSQRSDHKVAVACLRDVTEENRTKLQLQDFKQRVNLAANTGKLTFWYWDKTHNLIITDHTGEEHSAATEQPLNLWLEQIMPQDRDYFMTHLSRCQQQHRPTIIEVRVTAGQSYRTMRISMIPQLTEGVTNSVLQHQHAARIVGLSQDITEQKRIEENLRIATQEAESSNLAKSQFLANMSHEIRTPMNAITGIMTLLLDTPLPEKQAKLIQSANNAGISLVNIVNDILDFSKLEAGELSVVQEPFSLDDVLNQLTDLYSVIASSKSLLLQLDVKPEVYVGLIGDALRLGQVLGNLVSNALKFTEAGSVKVSVERVLTHSTSCRLRFTVSDTGVGMSQADLQTIFKPFRQADNSSTRKFGGTGLGLSICQRLLDMMGSELVVHSAPNQGATFSFDIDFRLQKDAKRYLDLIIDDKKAMIVIEDTALEETVTRYFIHWGLKIACFNNTKRACQVLADASEAFDILLVHLGHTEQYQRILNVCRHWLSNKATREHSLIIIAAERFAADPILQKLKPIFITPPPTPSRLFDAVNQGKRQPNFNANANMFDLAKSKAASIRNAKALLVEDVHTNQIVAVDLLEVLGLQVDVVENGLQAIEAVKRKDYDVVLMDFHMPVMDGLEATRQIRTFKTAQQLPIVAMTAAVFAQDKQAAFDCGMNAHIAKPIQIYQLACTLAEHISPAAPNEPPLIPGAGQLQPTSLQKTNLNHDLSVLADCVDLAAIHHNFSHNPDVLTSCLIHFRREFNHWTADIEQALAQADYSQARAIAHKLKGAAANLYATDVQQAAAELVQAVDQGHADPLPKVSSLLDTLLQKITQLLANLRIDLTQATSQADVRNGPH